MVTLDFCFKTFNLSLKRHRTSSAALVVWSRFKKGLKHHNLKLLVILLLLTFLVDNQDDDDNDDILGAKNWWSLIKIIGRSRARVELAVTKGGHLAADLNTQSFISLLWWSGGLVLCCSGGLVLWWSDHFVESFLLPLLMEETRKKYRLGKTCFWV